MTCFIPVRIRNRCRRICLKFLVINSLELGAARSLILFTFKKMIELRALSNCPNWPSCSTISQTKMHQFERQYIHFFFKMGPTTSRMCHFEFKESVLNWYTPFTDRLVWPASSDKLKAPLVSTEDEQRITKLVIKLTKLIR